MASETIGTEGEAGVPAVSPRWGRWRVLHVVQNLNYGGMERLVFEILRRADRQRFDNHVLTLQYSGRFARGLEAYATLHEPARSSRASMILPLRLSRRIRAIRPDVVHTHSGVWYKVSLAARMAGVPRVVHTDHGRPLHEDWLSRALDRLASRRTDMVIAVSVAVAQQLAGVVWHRERVVVVPNGVDPNAVFPRADNGQLRAELGISAAAPIIGSIGRLEPVKGYDVMIEAFVQLSASWANGTPPILVIAGDGSERHPLEELAAARSVGGSVRLLGWRDDVTELYPIFSVFSMSSHSEGTSVSLLEAMSAGLCPVVTQVGGNADVLGLELSHRLVPAANPAALAEAWRNALRDPARRIADGRRARDRVLQHFTLDAMVRAYAAIYRSTRP